MSEILSHQEATKAWVLLQQGGVTIDGGMEALDALWFSHEALRARLAEVEAERDDLAVDLGSTILRRKEAEARLAEVEQALRTSLRVIDTTHALAFGRDALVPPCDGRSLTEHGVGVYCWACKFTLQARAVLDKGEQG